MATTHISTIKKNGGRSVSQSLKDRADYYKNLDKTVDESGEVLQSCFSCAAETIDEDFAAYREAYRHKTGRDQGENEVLAYHTRQSFKPDEISPKKANELGYELAMGLTGGNFAFMVATHTDKAHIHNHIMISAVNLDCDRKFRNEKGSYKRVRKVADRISKEHNLHTIKTPNFPNSENNSRYDTPSKRDILVKDIDEILNIVKPISLDLFLKELEKKGYQVKKRGKSISVKPIDGERFIRLKSSEKLDSNVLPKGYGLEELKIKISEIEETYRANQSNQNEQEEPKKRGKTKKINLIIDLENSIKAQQSKGYENLAKGFNLKQAAETLLFLQQNNMTDTAELDNKINGIQEQSNNLKSKIESNNQELFSITEQQKHLGAYTKNRAVYAEYQKQKRSRNFRENNKSAIEAVEKAKRYFKELRIEKWPSIKELKQQYAHISQENYNLKQEQNVINSELKNLKNAEKNIDLILNNSPKKDEKNKKKDATER